MSFIYSNMFTSQLSINTNTTKILFKLVTYDPPLTKTSVGDEQETCHESSSPEKQEKHKLGGKKNFTKKYIGK